VLGDVKRTSSRSQARPSKVASSTKQDHDHEGTTTMSITAPAAPAAARARTTPNFHDAIEDFRARFSGTVLTTADDGYDTARQGWNLALDQRPALIAVAETPADIATAVRFARRCGLRVAIQATGHGQGRAANGALLIITANLTEVTVDPVARTAYVAAGAKWGAVLAPAQRHGLAPLLGSTTDVGAVGYTLGGGMGWLARRYGLASDHVIAFDLVTPDGIEVRASATENPELFWALKGGGTGSLGVVTGMEIRLFPVTTVYAGNLLYPIEMAADVMARWRDWVADAPRELTSSVSLMNFPPLDVVPEPIRGRSFVIVRGAWSGAIETGRELVDQWRAWRTPALDMWGEMPFTEADTISNDPVDPVPAMVTTEWTNELSADVIDALVRAAVPAPGQPPLLTFAEVRHAGGAVRELAATAANRVGRQDEFLIELVGMVPVPELGPVLSAHLEHVRAELAPYVTGATYLNFTEGADRGERSASAFGAEETARLAAVKRALDAENRFRHGVELPTA
jgi:FAD/FMN-containing dehydrogenase